jgi:hypothetical protein
MTDRLAVALVSMFEDNPDMLSQADIRFLQDHGLICNEGPGRSRILTEKGISYLPENYYSNDGMVALLRSMNDSLSERYEKLEKQNAQAQDALRKIRALVDSNLYNYSATFQLPEDPREPFFFHIDKKGKALAW